MQTLMTLSLWLCTVPKPHATVHLARRAPLSIRRLIFQYSPRTTQKTNPVARPEGFASRSRPRLSPAATAESAAVHRQFTSSHKTDFGRMTSSQPFKTCKVITAETIARGLLDEVKETLAKVQGTKPRKPTLAAFLANGDPAAVQYAQWSKKTCEENGFEFDLRTVDKDLLEEEIMKANEDDDVDGIIVYYPIFPQHSPHDKYVQETVDISKDVEGMRHKHLYNMYHNVRYLDPPENRKKSILPCTPLAVVKILEYLRIYNSILAVGNRLYGKTITVVNRSEVNGRPLAALLANDGATVYSVDITGVQLFTRGQGIKHPRHQVQDKEGWDLKDCLPLSDVVIGGVPSESFKIPTELVREGAVCINFSSFKNFDGPAIKEKASIYVPSVGKVTIAILLRNLVRLFANRPSKDDSDEVLVQAKTEAFAND